MELPLQPPPPHAQICLVPGAGARARARACIPQASTNLICPKMREQTRAAKRNKLPHNRRLNASYVVAKQFSRCHPNALIIIMKTWTSFALAYLSCAALHAETCSTLFNAHYLWHAVAEFVSEPKEGRTQNTVSAACPQQHNNNIEKYDTISKTHRTGTAALPRTENGTRNVAGQRTVYTFLY